MNRDELRKIFEKAQDSTGSHQAGVIRLIDIYKRTTRATFLSTFLEFLKVVICHKIENAMFTKRVLNFISLFCSEVTKKEEKETETHEFLTAVLEQTLEWSCWDIYDIRYNSCCFIATVLQDIGEEVQLEINLIDEVQRILLERMKETKVPIRLVAMSGLVRLQDPQNFECPVITSYLEGLLSGNAQIRRSAVESIAPNMLTLNKIKDRVRDVDPGVRTASFHKCADIGPLSFRIIDRHLILVCGFKETHEKVKVKFYDYLLPKWLTSYKGNYLKFVGSLKLIADEEDIEKMSSLCRSLIKEFFNKHQIDDLIDVLPINEEKLINLENLNNEVSLFWNILISLLRDSNMDEQLNRILPELTPFCQYISSVTSATATEVMDEWKYFEHQFDLLNLFEIAENYDFADEVGRRNMQSLATRLLQSHNFTSKLTKKLVIIIHKCSSNIEFFTNDMCQLISDIREPLMEEPLSEDQRRERDFKLAEFRVKMNIIEEKQAEALHQRDYQIAQQLGQQLANLKTQLEGFNSQAESEKIRVSKSDDETLCRCLDILASVLELPAVVKLTPSLKTCKDQFLVPLIGVQRAEPHWRMLKCLALYSMVDQATAQEYAKVLCFPIATYRTIPNNNVTALVTSICCITDLIGLYGVEIISQGEETTNTHTNTASDAIGKRKLYSNNEAEEDPTRVDNMTLSYIFEIFLDMLDDEQEQIRRAAIVSICKIVKWSFTMTPALFSRILLKWYNPLTAHQDSYLEAYLGLLIDEYRNQKNSGEVMKEAIIPTLNTIARAPRNSPLVDIDIDNVLMLFSEMMNLTLPKDDLRILALDFCMKIAENPTDRVVLFLTKLLFHFDMYGINAHLMIELIERAESLVEVVSDKWAKRYVQKFVAKLRQASQTRSNTTVDTTVQTMETRNTTERTESEEEGSVLQELNESECNMIKKPQQIKRRKKQHGKNCVVQVERLDLTKLNLNEGNETTLHTIPEVNMEMELDENLTIESVTSKSTESSRRSTRSHTVISETSDSDFSNDSEGRPKRSTRCRKKRIILSA